MTVLICMECGTRAAALDWRCRACAGPLDFQQLPDFDADAIETTDFTLWRYRAMLPVEPRITLGEGLTPLVHVHINGGDFHAKLEYLNPTGSYKDRGTTTMINHIAAHDVREVVEDSSGNAGASVAAYSNAIGIEARIFVPAHGSDAKKRLIALLGGELVEIEGPQQAKTDACIEAAEHSVYASHAWSPYFLLGQMTAAYEIWEQFGGRAPDAIATPLGHGGLFLGLARGFRKLYEAGLVDHVPRMLAVQAENSDPIVRGYETNADMPPAISAGQTVADGIIVPVPVRGKEVLATIRDTQGAAFRVSDAQIMAAHAQMMQHGLTPEPTSATTVAALPQIRAHIGESASLVCTITGNGLKYL